MRRWWARAGVLVVIAALALAGVRLAGCAERLAYWPSREGFVTPGGYEDVWIESPEGVRLHGWFMPAFGIKRGERAPAILHVHGNAGHVGVHDSFSDFLTLEGFHVLIFDYRGYGRSDDRGPLRRGALLRDTQAALAYLLSREDVDPDRVGVLGVSLGGGFALHAAAGEARVRAVATLSAFSSWSGIAGDAVPVLGALLMGSGVDGVDAAGMLGARPYLVMHGEADEIVPVRHARVLYDAARAAGVRAELWTLAGGDHNNVVQSSPEARTHLADFYRAELGAAPAPR